MKKRLLFLQVLFLLVLAPMAVEANDFLELERHYTAYTAGADKVHFKLPVYSRGARDYYVSNDAQHETYVFYTYQGVSYKLFNYSSSDNSSNPSGNDKTAYGRAWVATYPDRGIVEITNIYDGQRVVVPTDGVEHAYNVKKTKEAENDDDYVTWVEIDWYPQEALDEVTFNIGTHVNISLRMTGRVNYTKDWTLATNVQGNNNMIQPQLYDPYFYTVNNSGASGFGNAAVPYMVFYDPKSYHTSLDPTEFSVTERSGNIYVPTNDTLQTDYFATFQVYRHKAPKEVLSTQTTTKVTIPPYHRIYDFEVEEETDKTGTYTGNNVLRWHIKNPKLADLVEADYFEVQRATKEDFSDAKQLTVMPMICSDTAHVYTYVDQSRDTWTGNASMNDTNAYYSAKDKNYILRDDDGNPYASVTVELVSKERKKPAVPLYYRVRRASSSVWGWIEGFSQSAEMEKHNFLAPLDSVQADYTLDPEFETNRKVHFRIHIDNRELPATQFDKEKCELKYSFNHFLIEDKVNLVVKHEGGLASRFLVKIVDPSGTTLYNYVPLESGTYQIPLGSTITAYNVNTSKTVFTDIVLGESNIASYVEYEFGRRHEYCFFSSTSVRDLIQPYKQAIIDSMYTILQTKSVGIGRCMWDRTAHLILRRTLEETGQVSDFIIPQDSIVRQSDGSWIATYTDVANVACAHYQYAARIDQSKSDLHVQYDEQLDPVAIHGADLYFDEAATILSFTASQGDAVGQRKRGVTLSWVPSSTAVDEYVLTRVQKDSDAAPETIYTGLDNSFFDETAVPDVRYEYAITALYNCNGKSSKNSASAEGWRSPYGEISGSILMSDNSGMTEVKVVLQGPDGETLKTVITDADGTFKFDSLRYDIGSSTQYAIIPAHAYAVFNYNYTSAQSASITLSADHAIASGINFINTSTVRLTGRALYKYSTIPVAGAMFTLNGDTVLRNGVPLQTATNGNFELTLSKNQAYTLRIFKPGHEFEGDGILHVEEGKDTFALSKALDGVRFYDQTKVRLVGRVAGGIDQRDLPEAFGLGTNNLGDDLQLVLQLEGDNIAQIVHDPDDLSRDTVKQELAGTHSLFEKKRIIIRPDTKTGEYQIDLFPVKYKVVQATAKGYATLFAAGQGSEVVDLTNAPLTVITDSLTSDSESGQTSYVQYNAVYDRIYRAPVKVRLKPLLYGLEQDGYGEPSLTASGFDLSNKEKLPLFSKQADGTVVYTLGYPVFMYNRRYQFEAEAYEDYYYNNDVTDKLDRVPQRGGKVTVRNGMHNSTQKLHYDLDIQGKNNNIWLVVDHIQTQTYGEDALATVSIALEQEGNTVETDAFRAFVAGDIIQRYELTSTDADITLLDIIRDPGGNGSSAWVESGTTYSYGYTESYDWEGGINLIPKYGANISNNIGLVTAPQGNGSYIGSEFTSSKQISFEVPITHEWSWGYKYTYTFTTTEKISTSTSKNKAGIRSNADVFVGATTSQLTGKAKSISLINDTVYQARKPAIEAGTMHVLAKGKSEDGKPYYLVTGEKVVMGSSISNTFAYSQYYIFETVIPNLALQRENLLMTFPDSTAAQQAADAMNDVVYWYIDSLTSVNLHDPLAKDSYRMIVPTGSDKAYPDRIAAIDNIIQKWCTILIQNEAEKVAARQSGQHVGTYSVSFGNTLSHSDSYSATANYNELPQGWGLVGTDAGSAAASAAADVLKDAIKNFSAFWGKDSEGRMGTTISKAITALFKDESNPNGTGTKYGSELGTITNSSKWTMKFEPVLSFDSGARTSQDKTIKKSCGFTLVPDAQGDITVSVYRAHVDSIWKTNSSDIREHVGETDDSELYGSYVFFTQAGATYCIHEEEEKTKFYNKGTVINNGTMAIAVPEISIDRYEISNVPADQRAIFHIELKNAGEVQYGFASTGTTFSLSLTTDSNPHGAKVYVGGAPLVQGLSYFLTPGQVATQVLEVERGEVDDYENLALYFSVGDCPKTYVFLNFSVHFMPESSPVEIASPRQNWVMNTLSPHDSVGYYLPIDVTGFNIHHKNFDHIEFQYKLTKESDEMWVNQCSFYADDSLYNLATGNKAMIENGKITPFRFYGERDPMEQEYDLRAVSFSRYGSGFVSKASPVISGVKDTRPPVLFGDPQPADAILGIGDDLKLRFSEPIAGNYLDQDNNFQLKGVTNETGITAGTAIHFNGTVDSYAKTEIGRSLTGKSFSLDMLVRPTNPYEDETFFSYSIIDGVEFLFGKTADNRLFAQSGKERVTSQPLASPMLEFTRVIMTFDYPHKTVRFFAATDEVTDPTTGPLPDETVFKVSSPLVFGHGYTGDMLEARVWTKALEPDDIAATNAHYLTGYERELLAYYRMNEGKGDVMSDKANGATLHLSNTTWKLQKGISLKLENEHVQLAADLLGRSENYDETLMFWFKTKAADAPLFSAAWTNTDSIVKGTLLAVEDGKLVLHSGANQWTAGKYADGEWHHFALTLSRSHNTAALFVDGQITNTMAATKLSAISGAMYLGGEGFKGNIDEFAIFEQSLPTAMVQEFYNASPVGDEMGLMAYLPFEQQKQNANGVLEQVFSVNDGRQFRDVTTGEILDKVVPLVLGDQASLADKADKSDFAPTSDKGLLGKLNFGWTFNQEELLINLKMQDSEINKRTVYITVRDVEDLHGNPMPSPASWVAFVDRCPLRWDQNTQEYFAWYGDMDNEPGTKYCYQNLITNTTGKRHQFKIESLPEWLTAEPAYGSIDPLESKPIHFCPDYEMPVGNYTDIVYLTDENGLSEPLYIEYTVEARCPWESAAIDKDAYPNTMALRGQVFIESEYGNGYFDSDELDQVAVFCDGQMVGLANNTFAAATNISYVYLTIYGNTDMNGKQLTFKLWQASTGRIYNLTPSQSQTFRVNAMSGVSPAEPIRLSTSAGEIQQLALSEGWNWISWYVRPANTKLDYLFPMESGFSEGDIIKSPTTQSFAELTVTPDAAIWKGSLTTTNYMNMYMARTADAVTAAIEGRALTDEQRTLTIRKGWNGIAYLLSEPMSTRDALADYFDKATVGDIIKSRTQFAVFTENGKWEGSLQTLKPGQGYLLRRLGDGSVTMKYVKSSAANAPKRAQATGDQMHPTAQACGDPVQSAFSNPSAATNMTMIARVDMYPPSMAELADQSLRVYVAGELAAIAEPMMIDDELLYFLTIQSNRVGELRFEMGGETLTPVSGSISNAADSHHGSIKAPIMLRPAEDNRPYKIIDNDHVIIIRDGERYDVTGVKLTNDK